jgi:hypothetical protein
MNSDIEKIETEIMQKMSEVFFAILTNGLYFHYTDCKSLISILLKNELWISNVEYLNDKLEVNYSIEVIKESLNCGTIISQLEKDEFITDFEEVKYLASGSIYILSLSMDRDSLAMWNNYGNNDGYNIGFSIEETLHDLKNKKMKITNGKIETDDYDIYLGRIVYDRNTQIGFFSYLRDKYYEVNNMDIVQNKKEDILVRIWNLIVMGSFLIKSNHHSIENEFRIIVISNDNKYIHFREKNGIILPYLVTENISYQLPIQQITIGPKINDDIAEKGVWEIINQKGLGREIIKKSELKLRF